MKSILTLALSLFIMQATFAQSDGGKWDTVEVKTSAVCGMCKTTIETALAFEKGIKSSSLDVPSKVVTVVYNTKKTDPEQIREAISMSGYDADDVAADEKAYDKLHGCCKKDAH